MSERGSAYVLALFCLVAVSSTALLWQQKLQAYPKAVLHSWSGLIAEEAALSGIEYALALRASGTMSTSPQVIEVPGGKCKLTFLPSAERLVIRSEARVRTLYGWQEAVFTYTQQP